MSDSFYTPLLDVVEALLMVDDSLTEYRTKALINPHHNSGLLNAGCASTAKIPQTISFILRMLPLRPLLAGLVFEDEGVKSSIKKACESSDSKHILNHFEEFWTEKVSFPKQAPSNKTFDFEYPVLSLSFF